MSVALIVKWIADDGRHDEIAEILRLMRTHTRDEPGCISYEIFRSPDDPGDFMLVEVYEDEDAIRAHTEADYFRKHVLERAIPALKTRQRSTYVPLD
ncbi:MAG TPA: antibiotic biosynthesis monooxygenase family protein [Candidatus Dormibacteraeota bacterium]|jgi:quinol monooxygenase YgiN